MRQISPLREVAYPPRTSRVYLNAHWEFLTDPFWPRGVSSSLWKVESPRVTQALAHDPSHSSLGVVKMVKDALEAHFSLSLL